MARSGNRAAFGGMAGDIAMAKDETGQSRPTASWDLRLWCDCPGCQESVDLLADPEFWVDRQLQPCEHGTDHSKWVEVVCPECGHEFEVDLEY